MITGRKPGDNITLMNTIFFRERTEEGKSIEHLGIVYKDCDTGIKYKEELVNPDYEFYMVKPEKRKPYPQFFVPIEDVTSVSVPNQNLLKEIANATGNLDFFYENIKNGNRYENNKLHAHPDILSSDTHIEDHYRARFNKLYKNEPCRISKSFFDIETDTKEIGYEFPQPGQCPINAVSAIMQDTKTVYSFILRNNDNPLIEEFEKEVMSGTIYSELADFVVDLVGGPAKAEYYKLTDLNFKFLFYDEEIQLIADLFKMINTIKPDFLLAWNMAFDIPYIIERIRTLGYDPADIICHPDFYNKMCFYYIDQMTNELAERGDYASISSYTVFIDQMIHFASRRKGRQKYLKYNLDYIGEQVAGVRKLDYKHITTILGELPYKDFKTFIMYNIGDTIVQYCIEYKTSDVEYVFTKCNMNNTRYHKCHRQTVYLTNRGAKEFYKQGFIIGNNTNRFNPKPTEKFPGAFVADPTLLNDYSKVKINGRAVNIFDLLMDFDYASLYPSVYRQLNVAPNTLIGMVILNEPIHNKENKCKDTQWSRAGAFMEDMQSQVWLEFCARWFNFPRYEQLYDTVIYYFATQQWAYNGLRKYDSEGLYNPMPFIAPVTYDDGTYDPMVSTNLLFDPMEYGDYNHNEVPVTPLNKMKVEDVLNALFRTPNQLFRQ